MKRWLTKRQMLLAMACLLAITVGCDASADRGQGREPVQAVKRDMPKIQIVVNNSMRAFPEGLDENHNPYVDYIEEHTGVNLELIAPSFNGYQEKLNVIMTSGELPDLINTGDPMWVSRYVEEGALMPLDDLIATYGQDLLEVFPAEAWEAVTFNGSVYAIPSLTEVSGNEVMYARKDWLDRLGLEAPRTLEEYYEVMRAFAYDDPDGNGLDDTWGLTIQPSGLSRTAPFFGAFGVPRSVNQINQWKEVEGELVYSGILPETKQALEFLAKLYGAGILDREFILNKSGSFEDKIIEGRVGLFSANWFDTRGPILENKRQDPAAEWIRLDYPEGAEGQTGTLEQDLLQSYSVIPVGSTKAKEVIQVLNFIAGEGYRELKLGFEGQVWIKQGDVMVTNFEEHVQHIYRGTLHSIVDPNDAEVRKDRLNSLGMEYQLNENVEYILQHVVRSDFQGPPTPSMGRYGAKLMKLEEETFAKIIMGISPLSDFDEFESKWNHEGGWEITYEVNGWYRDQLEEEQP